MQTDNTSDASPPIATVDLPQVRETSDIGNRKVFVALPIYGSINPHFFLCALKMVQQVAQDGFRGAIKPHIGDSAIGRARNSLTRAFLESDCTHLLFIDSDLVFSMEQIRRIVAWDEPLVGGIYCKKQEGPVQYVLNGCDHPFEIRSNGLMEVKYVGTGFMRIAREVFETIIDKFGEELWYTPDHDPKAKEYDFWKMGVYKYPNGGRRWLSEDWFFPVDPSTNILYSDWKWKPIGNCKVGDRIVALDEESPKYSSRRFAFADVVAVFDKKLPQWKITHEEGEIITTSEHPWLVKRMWRKPNGRQVDNQHLENPAKWIWTKTENIKPGDVMASVVPYSQNPNVDDSDYLAGYIQGIFHSDGTISEKHKQATVRMKDQSPLDRLTVALSRHGIEYKFGKDYHDGNPKHSIMHKLGIYREASLRKLISITSETSIRNVSFASGYLAGMYDGDGSHTGGVAYIANLKRYKLDRIAECGSVIGVNFKERGDHRGMRITNANHTRGFWMSTLPANLRRTIPSGQPGNDGIVRMAETINRPVKVLSVESLGTVGDMRCISTTTHTFIANGFASHNCQMAIDCGYKVWIDRAILLKHSGEAVYPLSYQEDEIYGRANQSPAFNTRLREQIADLIPKA